MADIQKLQNAGIYTVDGLARTAKRELEGIKGLSAAKVDKLLKEGVTCWTADPKVSLKKCRDIDSFVYCSMDDGAHGLHHSQCGRGDAVRENQAFVWL